MFWPLRKYREWKSRKWLIANDWKLSGYYKGHLVIPEGSFVGMKDDFYTDGLTVGKNATLAQEGTIVYDHLREMQKLYHDWLARQVEE